MPDTGHGGGVRDEARLLSEDDLALIHALQLRPRAPWNVLGEVLGADPVTVARRWARLRERGEAWVQPAAGRRLLEQICLGFVTIDCAPGRAAEVARTLAGHPHMVTLERCADGPDILATVATADLPAMSRYALDRLPALPRVRDVRARIVTRLYAQGGQWRLSSLDPSQRAQLLGSVPELEQADPGPAAIAEADRSLLVPLLRDGRASYQMLARETNTSASTVKRRMDQLIRRRLLTFRCDFARPLAGYAVAVTLWAKVPAAELDDVGQALVKRKEIRTCAAVSGRCNLVVEASLHSLRDVPRFESQLALAHPALELTERAVVLRHEKLHAHHLDPYGRSVGSVPLDIWAEPGV
ncbi:Lrp/AsnC family transcriptional regulator [Streptomyces sp. NA04227]|uniref:Lrp/AsnC family transcriptional regulator n=1 Tax=Streptomyces sp. NA04227 TaxID=2742136 RepID=UPI001591EEF1|nr:Lrp/AsnC family transcriptional regulator [Streptomyces sp. NA04227]QKW07627.1 Lrp/AsnC family transcriptional regulator [Streptomyces sp. NA04227]